MNTRHDVICNLYNMPRYIYNFIYVERYTYRIIYIYVLLFLCIDIYINLSIYIFVTFAYMYVCARTIVHPTIPV